MRRILPFVPSEYTIYFIKDTQLDSAIFQKSHIFSFVIRLLLADTLSAWHP